MPLHMWTSLFWLSNFAQWSSELLNVWCMKKLSGFLVPCLPWLPPHFSLTGQLPPSLGIFYTVLDICLHTSSSGPDVLLSSLLSAIPETKRGGDLLWLWATYPKRLEPVMASLPSYLHTFSFCCLASMMSHTQLCHTFHAVQMAALRQ